MRRDGLGSVLNYIIASLSCATIAASFCGCGDVPRASPIPAGTYSFTMICGEWTMVDELMVTVREPGEVGDPVRISGLGTCKGDVADPLTRDAPVGIQCYASVDPEVIVASLRARCEETGVSYTCSGLCDIVSNEESFDVEGTMTFEPLDSTDDGI